jgi:hypothetical protein
LKSTPHSAGRRAQEDGEAEGREDLGEHGRAEDPADETVVHAKPRRKRRATVMGSEARGSSGPAPTPRSVANMASMRNSPWAKLTISMRPKMRRGRRR